MKKILLLTFVSVCSLGFSFDRFQTEGELTQEKFDAMVLLLENINDKLRIQNRNGELLLESLRGINSVAQDYRVEIRK